MPTGSLAGSEEARMDLRELQLEYRPPPRSKRRPRAETCPSLDNSSAAEEEEEEDEEEEEEDEDEEDDEDEEAVASKKKRAKGASGTGDDGGLLKKQPATGRSGAAPTPECKQSQRNAANARERARMRVLSKAFSRLKTSLPWVPPDTKLSKLDTLRLASSYIAHLRQLLQEDCYEKGYVHPVNLHFSASAGSNEQRVDPFVSRAIGWGKLNFFCNFSRLKCKDLWLSTQFVSTECPIRLGHLWFQEDQNLTPKMSQQPADYVELQLS